jgi:TP901 family phage tail tape measure protein
MAFPVAAAAVGVGKLALDFEDSMNEIKNLVGASDKQIADWSNKLLKLGPELGKSPRELAQALYFVTSSGIPAAKALDVVTVAAKGSALGLGQTETVADAVTSAMNGYKKEHLSAAHATNTLALAVKYGKGEADSYGPVIGRVVPVAAQLGVRFDEVAAALSSMTLQGASTAEAGTAIRAVMTSLYKPTADANDLFKKWGTSAEELRTMLGQQGLLKTLQYLSEKVHGNGEEMAAVFPNIRALVGAFNLTGQNADQVSKIFDGLAKNTDVVNSGFKRLGETDGQKAREAIAGLESEAIKLGESLLSTAAPAMKAFTDVLSDPKLTSDEKVTKVMQMISDGLDDLLPDMATFGGKAVKAIASGFFDAWQDGDVLQKIILGVGAARIIGGPGIWSMAGKQAAGAMTAGFKTNMAAGSLATSTQAAVLGGAGPATKTPLATKLRGSMAAIGKNVLGLALATGIFSGLGTAMSDERGDGFTDFMHNAGVGFFRTFGVDLGDTTAEAFTKSYESTLNQWAQQPGGLTKQVTIDPDIEATAKSRADELIKNVHVPYGESSDDAYTKIYDEQIKSLMEDVKAKRPSVQQLFADTWDDMTPDEQVLATKTRQALVETNKIYKEFHFSLPTTGILTDPAGMAKSYATIRKNLEQLKSGVLSNMKDIQAVLHQSMQEIQNNPDLNGADAKNAMAAQFREAALAMGMAIKNGTIPDTKKNLKTLKGMIDKANLLSGSDPLHLAKGFTDSWDQAHAISKKSLAELTKDFDQMPVAARKKAAETMVTFARELNDKGKLSDTALARLESTLARRWDIIVGDGEDGSAKLMGGVGLNFVKMAEIAGQAITLVKDNANKGLGKFGAKELKFTVKAAGAILGSTLGAQAGAYIEGARMGDKNPAMLEDGEYVLNKKAVKVAGRQALDRLNFGLAPRMQKGGSAGDSGQVVLDAGVDMSVGDEPAILADLHKFAAEMKQVVYVISGYRTDAHSEAVGGSAGDPHTTGSAADIGLGSALRSSMLSVSEGQLNAVGLYRPYYPANSDEVNHVQLMAGAAADGAKAVADAISYQIGKITVGGPDGPLKDQAQGVASTLRTAANEYLKKQMPAATAGSSSVTAGGDGVLSSGDFLKIAHQALQLTSSDTGIPDSDGNAQSLLVLAGKESTLRVNPPPPNDINTANGDPSMGLMQITGSNFRKYHEPGTSDSIIDPLANIAASINYQKATYGGLTTNSPYAIGGSANDSLAKRMKDAATGEGGHGLHGVTGTGGPGGTSGRPGNTDADRAYAIAAGIDPGMLPGDKVSDAAALAGKGGTGTWHDYIAAAFKLGHYTQRQERGGKIHGPPLFTREGPAHYDAAFKHNAPFALPGPYQTDLGEDEAAFRKWVAKNRVLFDPDAEKVDYDMRGFWAAGGRQAAKNGHFPDTWKTPYDTSFSRESKYATANNPFGWVGDRLVDARDGQVVFRESGKDDEEVDGKQHGGIVAASSKVKSIKDRLQEVEDTLGGKMTGDAAKQADKIHKQLDALPSEDKLNQQLDALGDGKKDADQKKKIQAELDERAKLEKDLSKLRGGKLSDDKRKELIDRRQDLKDQLHDWQAYVGKLKRKKLKKLKKAGLSPRLAAKLKNVDTDISEIEENIMITEAKDVRWNSEDASGAPGDGTDDHDGTALSPNERANEVDLYTTYIAKLRKREDILESEMAKANKELDDLPAKIKKARSDPASKWMVPALQEDQRKLQSLLSESRQAQIETQGATGKGGAIFQAKERLNELGAPDTTSTSSQSSFDLQYSEEREAAANALLAESLKKNQLYESEVMSFSSVLGEMGANLPFVGAYEKGGTIPLPVGQAGLAVVHGQETITPAGASGPISLTLMLSGDMALAQGIKAEMVSGDAGRAYDRSMGRQSRRIRVAPGK